MRKADILQPSKEAVALLPYEEEEDKGPHTLQEGQISLRKEACYRVVHLRKSEADRKRNRVEGLFGVLLR